MPSHRRVLSEPRHIVYGMTEPLTRVQLGALGEQLTANHLTSLGWRTVERNWRCRWGEIDLIMQDPGASALVFVEVKTRRGGGFGGAEEAVTPAKLRRLRRLAGLWLAAQDKHWAQVRIDVVGVRVGPGTAPVITHLRGVG